MAQTIEEMIAFFEENLRNSRRNYYSEFYIGITNDVERRLFQEHNVNKETMWWAYTTANTKEDAEYIERYYLGKGMKGNTGGGTPDSKVVYCYAVGPTTVDR